MEKTAGSGWSLIDSDGRIQIQTEYNNNNNNCKIIDSKYAHKWSFSKWLNIWKFKDRAAKMTSL